jgi:hypothetical protein
LLAHARDGQAIFSEDIAGVESAYLGMKQNPRSDLGVCELGIRSFRQWMRDFYEQAETAVARGQ